MSYTEFEDKPTILTGDLADPTQMNDAFDGIQAEFEERSLAAGTVDGVITGLTPSISTTNIAIAAGDGYCQGKRFAGGTSVSFSASDGAATYYVYCDHVNETYAKSSSAPDATYLVLCTVAWDGATTLSSLVDKRKWGVTPQAFNMVLQGTVSTSDYIGYAVVDRDWYLEDVRVLIRETGTGGYTTVDVHVGAQGSAPATVFATQSLRPVLWATNADHTAVTALPDTNQKRSAGDIIEVMADTAATAAVGVAVTLSGRYY